LDGGARRPARRPRRPRARRAARRLAVELRRGPAPSRARAALRLAARLRARRGDAAADARRSGVGRARLGRARRRRPRRRRSRRALEAPAWPRARACAPARARHGRPRAPAARVRARDRLRPGEPLPLADGRRAHVRRRAGGRRQALLARRASGRALPRSRQAVRRLARNRRTAALLRAPRVLGAKPRAGERRPRGDRAQPPPLSERAARTRAPHHPPPHVPGRQGRRPGPGTPLPREARRRDRVRPRRPQGGRLQREAGRGRPAAERRPRAAPALPAHAAARTAAAASPVRPRGERLRPDRGRLPAGPGARPRAARPVAGGGRRSPAEYERRAAPARACEAPGMTTDLLEWGAPGPYRVAFSTRVGGVSEGDFASLNLGILTDDDPARVVVNRTRLCEAVGADPDGATMAWQRHGRTVTRAQPRGIITPGTVYDHCDGLWSDEPGRAMLLLTADCLPIAIARKPGRPPA